MTGYFFEAAKIVLLVKGFGTAGVENLGSSMSFGPPRSSRLVIFAKAEKTQSAPAINHEKLPQLRHTAVSKCQILS
jgi:hypothetical protein